MLVEHHFNRCLCASLVRSYTCVPLIRIQGFHLTPDTNCQLARCMVKLGRKATAEELFSTVCVSHDGHAGHQISFCEVTLKCSHCGYV